MPKIPSYSAASAWASGDLLYMVSDPAGTPASKKITLDNVLANVVSRLTVSKNAAASAPPVAITGSWFSGGSATTTKPQMLIEASGATSTGWNTAGTGCGVNAASGFAGNLIDLQVNGVRKVSIDGNGRISWLAGFIAGDPEVAIYSGIVTDYQGYCALGNGGIQLAAGTLIHWSGTPSNPAVAKDLALLRDAANTLGQRNGTNAQTFNTYFSWADASNYTRLAIKTATGIHTLETESAGTGEADIDLAFIPKGSGRIRFGTHAAIAAETVTGYITIKDASGTSRKIAVVS